MIEKIKILSEKERVLEQKRREVGLFVTIYENPDGDPERRVGVDPELRETLTLLLALGMHPDQSCWGHPERLAKDKYVSLTPSISFTGGLPDREYTDEDVAAASLKAREQAAELKGMLEKFYQQRKVPLEAKIILDYIEDMPAFTLRSEIDREVLVERAVRARMDSVEASRLEWRDFETFLKDYYLKS